VSTKTNKTLAYLALREAIRALEHGDAKLAEKRTREALEEIASHNRGGKHAEIRIEVKP
jgi:hypothetical protein